MLIETERLKEWLTQRREEFGSMSRGDVLAREDSMVLKMIAELEQAQVEASVFDREEIHENCTVQVLENTVTGEVSVGWWQNEMEAEK